jgi:hypothetical protein
MFGVSLGQIPTPQLGEAPQQRVVRSTVLKRARIGAARMWAIHVRFYS